MSLFAIGDLHLSIGVGYVKSMDRFGGPWIDHVGRLREDWDSRVSAEDIVVILGDVSWGLKLEEAMPDLAWIDERPGRKLILRGNHDLWWSSMAKMRDLFPSITFLRNDAVDTGEHIVFGSRGWICPGDSLFVEGEDRKIYERELLRLRLAAGCAEELKTLAAAQGRFPKLIGVMHYPPTNDKKQPSGFTDIFSRAGAAAILYGHLHGETAFYRGPSGVHYGMDCKLCSLDKLGGKLLRIDTENEE